MSTYLVPTSRLPKALLEYLALGPATTDELCAHTGYSSSAIRYRMNGLEEAGLAHHFKFTYTMARGTYFVWHLGPRSEGAAANSTALPYPPNKIPLVIRRDPLVAAFFGPAAPRQSAPCCTRCHMEQGGGHQAGCIVAMVAA